MSISVYASIFDIMDTLKIRNHEFRSLSDVKFDFDNIFECYNIQRTIEKMMAATVIPGIT